MARCAQCAGERIRVAGGTRLSRPALGALFLAVSVTLFDLGRLHLRHRPGDWEVRGPSIGVIALMWYWAMAAMMHSRHEQTSRLRLWAPVVAKSAIAFGLLCAWAVVWLYLGK